MAITSGFTYSCSDSAVGGISDLWITNTADIVSTTETAGEITAITFASGKFWYKVGLKMMDVVLLKM